MTTRDLMMALLITSVLGAGVALRRHENGQNAAKVRGLTGEGNLSAPSTSPGRTHRSTSSDSGLT